MNTIRRIAKCCLLATLVLCSAARAMSQFPDEPATLQDLTQTLRKTAESAMSLPPPTAEKSQDFLTAFVKDPYLQHFPHPRGEILSIANQIWYLWTYRRELNQKMEAFHKTKKGRSERTLSDANPHGLLASGTTPSREPTKEEEEILQPFRERVENIEKSIARSLTALEEMAQRPENQKFALQKNSPTRKALAKLEKSYEAVK